MIISIPHAKLFLFFEVKYFFGKKYIEVKGNPVRPDFVRVYVTRSSSKQESILPNFFFRKTIFFHFFAIKLGHFFVNTSFLSVTNTQVKQRKSENKEKRSLVGLTPGQSFQSLSRNRISQTF
jgi:hypothetical protein